MSYEEGYIDGVRGVCTFLEGMRAAAQNQSEEEGNPLCHIATVFLDQIVTDIRAKETDLLECGKKKEGAMSTKIEWADLTINPVVGCFKCSPGCDNCYAERFAARLEKNPATASKYAGVVDENGHWSGNIGASDYSCFDRLPKTPKRVFVGSMTDLFYNAQNDYPGKAWLDGNGNRYEFAPPDFPIRILDIIMKMSEHEQHTFMVLTKRPEAMKEVLEHLLKNPLPHLWLGVTACNQKEAAAKIPILLSIPAAKRFVSVEPMLGPVDLWGTDVETHGMRGKTGAVSAWKGHGLDWVICGGETGPGARPMHPDWVRCLRDQCKAAGTPFFFKGWGEWYWDVDSQAYYPEPENFTWRDADGVPTTVYRIGKRRSGRLLDGVEHNAFPEVSHV